MRILTEEESRETLQGKTVGAFAAQLADRLQLVEGTYSTPVNSGTQIALSRLFAYLVLGDAPVCLHISGWSIALSTEKSRPVLWVQALNW